MPRDLWWNHLACLGLLWTSSPKSNLSDWGWCGAIVQQLLTIILRQLTSCLCENHLKLNKNCVALKTATAPSGWKWKLVTWMRMLYTHLLYWPPGTLLSADDISHIFRFWLHVMSKMKDPGNQKASGCQEQWQNWMYVCSSKPVLFSPALKLSFSRPLEVPWARNVVNHLGLGTNFTEWTALGKHGQVLQSQCGWRIDEWLYYESCLVSLNCLSERGL